MALKLGKCRLCLKLGDFYSIFTVDNDVQLSEMVMDCSRIKVYDGDGLPDKVCSECIQKLSSAYIFKQQCERSDQELRRNYIPPPGFSISPPPPINRQSSDSAFSTQTDSSNLKSSFTENKVTPVSRNRKRSVESDTASVGSRSQDNSRPSSSKRVEELRKSQRPKRPRYSADSDYEDPGASSFINETDSDEPLLKNEHACPHCPKTFKWKKSMKIHMAHVHTGKKANSRLEVAVNIPVKTMSPPDDDDDQMGCEKCGKKFKLKIMLNRHQESCQLSSVKSPPKSPMKELVITLEPIDAKTRNKKPTCEYCTAHFKTVENLEKHLRVVHAATRKKSVNEPKPKGYWICNFCKKDFSHYLLLDSHWSGCMMRKNLEVYDCPMCPKVFKGERAVNEYVRHVKGTHYPSATEEEESFPTTSQAGQAFECRMCSKKLATQALLIKHLAEHMSGDDDNVTIDDDDFDSR